MNTGIRKSHEISQYINSLNVKVAIIQKPVWFLSKFLNLLTGFYMMAANQLTGFYMMTTLTFNELNYYFILYVTICCQWHLLQYLNSLSSVKNTVLMKFTLKENRLSITRIVSANHVISTKGSLPNFASNIKRV